MCKIKFLQNARLIYKSGKQLRSYNTGSVCWRGHYVCASVQLDVKILASDDKLMHLYIGLPAYDALVEYLESKTRDMIVWNSSHPKN